MKRIFEIILSVLIVLFILSAAACQNTTSPETSLIDTQTAQLTDTSTPIPSIAEDVKKVGISMPIMRLQRWSESTEHMNLIQPLKAAGYEVDIQFGDSNDASVQIAQIENMIIGGCDVLVIAAFDSEALREVLASAKEKDIPVIAYDRLIMDTDAVTYYVTFDRWLVSKMQGEFIRDKLDLDNAEGSFNIEFFSGDPGDSGISSYLIDYGMEVLKPYLDSGKLVCLSGQTSELAIATEGWSSEKAQVRMQNLIDAQKYGPNKTKLDAVFCLNDSIAQGVTNALVDAGYTKENFPIITGQDCDKTSVKNMIEGLQLMSVFKDVNVMDAKVVEMITAIFSGQEVPVNDTETYDNGTGIIPSCLLEPFVVTKDNYLEILIDSGYYMKEELLQ